MPLQTVIEVHPAISPVIPLLAVILPADKDTADKVPATVKVSLGAVVPIPTNGSGLVAVSSSTEKVTNDLHNELDLS